MKKAFVLTVMLVLITGLTANAQLDKGNWFIAGSNRLDLKIGGEKEKYNDDLVEGDEFSYFEFNFQPDAGYFFIDNLVAGLFMDIDFYSEKYKDDDFGYKDKTMTFIFGPFARYYLPVGDKFIPYVGAGVGFGIYSNKSKYDDESEWEKYKERVFSYKAGGGATYFFNDMIGLDAFLGFNHTSYIYKDDDGGESRSTDKYKYLYNEFVMQLGIVVVLD